VKSPLTASPVNTIAGVKDTLCQVDLNADLGEGFAHDTPMLAHVTSINIACGFHAGDARVMQGLVRQAHALGVGIGAHPSFPDRIDFGRQEMHLTPDEIRADLLYQLGALAAIARAESASLSHVKLHGALYNQAARDRELAQVISLTLAEFNPNLKIMALAGSVFVDVLRETGLTVVQEVFADRGYTAQGTLVPRHAAGALITDENDMLAQVLGMVKYGKVRAVTGEWIAVQADTICLHGDGLHAATFARRLRQFLQAEGVTVAKLAA
jgi:UPF0271 protein